MDNWFDEKVENFRNNNGSYLVINSSQPPEYEFQIEMLIHNKIKYLLPVQVIREDEDYRYYYEVTEKNSLGKYFEQSNISFDKIRNLLNFVSKCVGELEKYMLDNDFIILDPAYIYIDEDLYSISFIYYPVNKKTFSDSFKELLEYFIEKISYEDKAMVEIIYEMHQMITQDNWKLDRILAVMSKYENQRDNVDFHKNETVEAIYNEQINHAGIPYGGGYQDQSEAQNQIQKEERYESKKENLYRKIEKLFGIKEKSDLIYSLFTYAVDLSAALLIVRALLKIANYIESQQYRLIASQIVHIVITLGAAVVFVIYLQKKRESVRNGSKNFVERRENRSSYNIPEEEQETTLLYDYAKQEQVRLLLKSCLVEQYEDILVSKNMFIIGKSANGSDYQLEDSSVSRVHARLSCRNSRWMIEDMDSTNGTRINGRRLEEKEQVELKQGDLIEITKYSYVAEFLQQKGSMNL